MAEHEKCGRADPGSPTLPVLSSRKCKTLSGKGYLEGRISASLSLETSNFLLACGHLST